MMEVCQTNVPRSFKVDKIKCQGSTRAATAAASRGIEFDWTGVVRVCAELDGKGFRVSIGDVCWQAETTDLLDRAA